MVETITDPSKSGQEFKTTFLYDSKTLVASVYFTPLVKYSPTYNKVVRLVSSRKQLDKKTGQYVTCLGIAPSDIKEQLDTVNISLYLFVNEKGKSGNDQASGSLQIHNWDIDPNRDSQAWICDLCRNSPDPSKKSAYSPVKPLLHLFEQLAHYIFGKTEVYLEIDQSNESVLKPLYQKYGFVVDDTFKSSHNLPYITMKKTIVPDPSFALFPFGPSTLLSSKRTYSSSSSTKKKSKGGKRTRRSNRESM